MIKYIVCQISSSQFNKYSESSLVTLFTMIIKWKLHLQSKTKSSFYFGCSLPKIKYEIKLDAYKPSNHIEILIPLFGNFELLYT